MPRVPVYERRVTERPVPSVGLTPSARPEAFGAGEARILGALAQTAGVFAQEAIRTQNLTDKAVARDQLNVARSEARQYMGDVYTRKGKDAINVYEEAERTLGELRQKSLEGLTNQRQKDLFTVSYDQVMNGHLERAITFQTKSRVDFEKDTIGAENATAIDDAVAARLDKGAIQQSENTIIANTRYLNQGLGEPIIEQQVAAAVNNLHTNILDAILKDSPEAAQGYLKENWDKFNPTAREALKELIDDKAESAWVIKRVNLLAASGLSLDQQLAAVDEIEDAEKATKLRKLVKDRHAESEAIKKIESKEKLNKEADLIYRDPFAYQLDVVNFTTEEQDYLYSLQEKLKKDKLAERGVGKKTATNPDTFMKLMSMPIDELREEDLRSYVKELSSGDFEEVFKRQRDGDKTVSQMQLLKTAIGGMKEFDTKEEEEAGARMSQLIAEYQKRLDTIPPAEQTEEKLYNVIFKELLAPVSTDTGWFDGLKDKALFRFEIPYLEEQRERTLAYEQNVPEKLKDFQNVQYHKASERYYVDGNGIRDIYDKYGNYIKSYRKVF